MPTSVPQLARALESGTTRSVDDAFLVAEVLRRVNSPFAPVLVAERYELVRKIGSGTFGAVYEAHDHELDRRVALKVLDLDDPDVAMREGQVLAELHHENVVAIYDHGIGPDFRYLVLQLCDGPPLHNWLVDKSIDETLPMFVQAGHGLAAAHAKGLVHRDFKPSNVRIGADGKAIVVDFGLARHKDTLEGDPNESGVFAGTLEYASPGRLLGEPADELSDQFSFCVALWEAVSGVNPFGRCTRSTTTRDRLQAIVKGPVGTPRAPRRVIRALRRGLSLRPHDRFLSMEALTDALMPKPVAWTSKAMLVAVIVGAGLTQLPLTLSQGASSEFVASTHAGCLGLLAVAAARQGKIAGALLLLDSAERAKRSKASSRGLARASKTVALELEGRITSSMRPDPYIDAADAWHLVILFARGAGDAKLQRGAWAKLNALDAKAAQLAPR